MRRPQQTSISNLSGLQNLPESIKRDIEQYEKESRPRLKALSLMGKVVQARAAFNAFGNTHPLGILIAEHPQIATRMCRPKVLQDLIDRVNKNEHEGIVEVWRALLPGLADPHTRVVWLASLYSLITTLRLKKSTDIIGRCEICKNFFLRVRKDQKCCSHKCANLYRVRKWMGKYYESYKQQRTRPVKANRRSLDTPARRIANDRRSPNTRIRKAIDDFIWNRASAADWRQWVAAEAGVSLDDLSRALGWGKQGKPDGVRLTKLQAQYLRKFEKGEKP